MNELLSIFVCLINKLVKLVTPQKNDYVHCRDRRDTDLYKKKLKIVKNIWIGAGILMVIALNFTTIWAALALVFVLTFLTTFLAFVILDETE